MTRLIAAAACLVLLAACGGSNVDYPAVAGAAPRLVAASDNRHEAGRRIYNFRCYYCHGYSGDARTLASTFLTPPPRDFTAADSARLTRDAMLATLRHGRQESAMASFAGTLTESEMLTVIDFVRDGFMMRKAANTRYHTPENGWPNHERYRDAFAFAIGEIPVDSPWEQLSPAQQRGKRLYLASCVTCHDRGHPVADAVVWEGRPLSYPRNQYRPGGTTAPDVVTSASPYAVHDKIPQMKNLPPQARRGEKLYQANCAFCHAADGTGKNWIGSFMEPHPRNLTDPLFMGAMTRARMRETIREGLPGTSMPAWKSVLEPKEIDAVVAYVSAAFHPIPD